jgi:hypothetical protein
MLPPGPFFRRLEGKIQLKNVRVLNNHIAHQRMAIVLEIIVKTFIDLLPGLGLKTG